MTSPVLIEWLLKHTELIWKYFLQPRRAQEWHKMLKMFFCGFNTLSLGVFIWTAVRLGKFPLTVKGTGTMLHPQDFS